MVVPEGVHGEDFPKDSGPKEQNGGTTTWPPPTAALGGTHGELVPHDPRGSMEPSNITTSQVGGAATHDKEVPHWVN